ncbi:hypothetical protein MLD38_001233 [Melastoma candidum]|nr:hypothetical protein MLD38_001233 [Melastoma candidum]
MRGITERIESVQAVVEISRAEVKPVCPFSDGHNPAHTKGEVGRGRMSRAERWDRCILNQIDDFIMERMSPSSAVQKEQEWSTQTDPIQYAMQPTPSETHFLGHPDNRKPANVGLIWYSARVA